MTDSEAANSCDKHDSSEPPGSLAELHPDSEDARDSSPSRHRVPSRSPHPYLRRQVDLLDPTAELSSLGVKVKDGRGARAAATGIFSASESGTEADDEAGGLIKALPAPPYRPRKGLRTGDGLDLTQSLGPAKLEDDLITFRDLGVPDTPLKKFVPEINFEDTPEKVKAGKRRRGEVLRRVSEIAFLGLLGALVLGCQGVWWLMGMDQRALIVSHASLLASIAAFYPLRLIAYSWIHTIPRKPWRQTLQIPASSDPAQYIYPTFLPVIVALSIFSGLPTALVYNVVLGIAGLPQHLISTKCDFPFNSVHWIATLVPIFLAETAQRQLSGLGFAPQPNPDEILSTLFPLHQALVPFLHLFTGTSLLPAELQLLSISLINLLLLAKAPYASILASLLWGGGLAIFLFCAPVIQWGITLARIPRWRLRRAGRIIQARQSFLAALNESLKERLSQKQRCSIVDSDADDDDEEYNNSRTKGLGLETLKDEVINTLKQNFFPAEDAEICSASEKGGRALSPAHASDESRRNARRRRNTLPASIKQERSPSGDRPKKKRPKSSAASYFLSLTPQQASLRKWIYSGILYSTLVLIILIPVRSLIAYFALDGAEPIGWALGYFFGDLQEFRFSVVYSGLDGWIRLPSLPDSDTRKQHTLGFFARIKTMGAANIRLLISANCVIVMILGMLAVLSLPSSVEVDTRRKVFHGMMVAMLLPTIPLDPPFIALALAIVLAVFLLLDILRASQLPPLSRPLAAFLTPYVDGRDLRGPVVISHIFLLVGCAVPLWLSLASLSLQGPYPWQGWEAPTRDAGMISGVVCVGMGDAAASLVGRRIGRHKWPWVGGKSLEGSAAFAGAVTIGLIAGKVWLSLGRWDDVHGGQSILLSGLKAVIAASGASFMEAVLTGGNDNVVVPVALWILVRALGV